jgi:hypothetical protein
MVAVYSRKVLTWRQDTVHFGRQALVRIVPEAVHSDYFSICAMVLARCGDPE